MSPIRQAAPPLRWRRFWQALAVLVTLVVIWGSLTPQPPQIPVAEGDKLEHFAAYFAIMLAWGSTVARAHHGRVFILAVLLGGGLELAQMLTPARDPAWGDLLADALGAGAAWWLLRWPLWRILLKIESLPGIRNRL
ncbi:MAG: VanZ family protein [Gammaproteobacteria bacterium]